MVTNEYFLLIGGEGFLGKGLQEELSDRGIKYKSVDIHTYDLTKTENIEQIVLDLKDITHIVLLASKVGALLFESNPEIASKDNKAIFENVIEATKIACETYNKKFTFIYYSTCEIFWSLKSKKDVITQTSKIAYDTTNLRSLYSDVKYHAELLLKDLYNTNKYFNNVKIFRPFNVSGKYQQRGVVYYMVYSALQTNTIYYNKDTTRTITPDWVARKLAVDYSLIDNDGYSIYHLVDNNNSFSLKWLAQMIRYILNDKYNAKQIQLKSIQPDKTIRYRHTSKPDKLINAYKFLPKLELIIDRIIKNVNQYIE